jgi:hypothetical protein
VKAPTPPRRPATLIAASTAGRDAPAQLGRGGANATHAIANLVDAPADEQNKDDAALAYAPHGSEKASATKAQSDASAKTNGRKIDFVPARLDRSNFNTLTATTPAARASARPVLGAPIAPVRSAARATEPSVLLPPARPAHLVGFSASESSPPTDKFSTGASKSRTQGQKNGSDQKK